jgi:hypothetical protein
MHAAAAVGAEGATADLVTRSSSTASLLLGIVARALGENCIAVGAVLHAGVRVV